MTCQIRDAVFETNSSSSHSVTVSSEELSEDCGISKETLRSGVIRAQIAGHYGWEWRRYYTPGAKIAYLATQLAGGYASGSPGKDVTAEMRQNTRVGYMLDLIEKRTGCRVEIIGASDASIDHDSAGVGVDLLSDEDEFMRFVFGTKSFVQTGNDNSLAPLEIDTDLGIAERYHENRYVKGPLQGEFFDFTLDLYGSNIFMQPEGAEPVYACVEEQWDLQRFIRELDGLTLDKIGIWMPRPKEMELPSAELLAQDAVHEYITELCRLMPEMKISENMRVETQFDFTDRSKSAWEIKRAAVYALKAVTAPERIERMMAVLQRHSSMPGSRPAN